MKPSRFVYHAPRQLDEVLGLLAEHTDEAKVLAGGQSLMPLLNFRLAAPEHLIDINRVAGLHTLTWEGDTVTIPALVRQRDVERSAEVAARLPVLTAALECVAHPQVRNRGTVCGSLAHADPAAELPAIMLALDATFTAVSATGSRDIAASDFFLFHLTTALEPDELLRHVTIRVPGGRTVSGFREFAARHGDFALAAVAAVCSFDEDHVVTGCRLTAAGVAATPVRLTDAERIVAGTRLDDGVLSDVEAAVRDAVDATDDIHASAGYRRRVTGVMARRALADVRSEEEEEEEVTHA